MNKSDFFGDSKTSQVKAKSSKNIKSQLLRVVSVATDNYISYNTNNEI